TCPYPWPITLSGLTGNQKDRNGLGREINCQARSGGQSGSGKALLETDHILFRGDFRVKVLFASVKSVRTDNGWLLLEHDLTTTELELGQYAEKWAHAI